MVDPPFWSSYSRPKSYWHRFKPLLVRMQAVMLWWSFSLKNVSWLHAIFFFMCFYNDFFFSTIDVILHFAKRIVTVTCLKTLDTVWFVLDSFGPYFSAQNLAKHKSSCYISHLWKSHLCCSNAGVKPPLTVPVAFTSVRGFFKMKVFVRQALTLDGRCGPHEGNAPPNSDIPGLNAWKEWDGRAGLQ